MSLIHFDTGQLAALAVDLPNLGRASAKVMDDVIAEGAKDLEETWRRNATLTSGKHGRLYPKSIDRERLLSASGFSWEIGPNPAKPQGGMSFEDGSVNQPPHNDGKKAANEVVPRIGKRVDSALGLLGL